MHFPVYHSHPIFSAQFRRLGRRSAALALLLQWQRLVASAHQRLRVGLAQLLQGARSGGLGLLQEALGLRPSGGLARLGRRVLLGWLARQRR
jgi:hypothetical protein